MIEFLNFNKEAPAGGYWDQTLIEDMVWDLDGNIVIIPATQNIQHAEQIARYLDTLGHKALVILTGDEEQLYPIHTLENSKHVIYTMYPHAASRIADKYIAIGYTPAVKLLEPSQPEPEYTWCFLGQVTHQRRRDIAKRLETLSGGYLLQTQGFTQGLPPKEYMNIVSKSKVSFCPKGAVVQDTFRLYETLEAGRLPIVDKSDFWELLYDSHPIPILNKTKEIPDLINYHVDTYPVQANICSAWWQKYKRDLRKSIIRDSGSSTNSTQITTLISTSPVPSNPNTEGITATINSVRERLPHSEIIVMFDGIREEQQHLAHDYELFKQKLLYAINRMPMVTPFVAIAHLHQAEMTRQALDMVDTDLILFVEHDTPLCESIPFDNLSEILKTGELNVVRLMHEAHILEPHKYLMLDSQPISMCGVPIIRTGQWSQRPHLSTKKFYSDMLNKYFTADSRTMIEDRIHSYPYTALVKKGKSGWKEFKIGIYAPEGDMKRSIHLDLRANEPKYMMHF